MASSFSLRAAVLVIALFGAAPAALADKPDVYTGRFSNIAVGGYDPVSYFSGDPQKGEAQYSLEHDGVEYRFVTQENLDAFKQDPELYAPQYGGYCAWAVAEGKTAKGDPQHWRVVDGKLYLNFNAKIQKRWEADTAGFIEKGDANWPDVLKD